MVMMELRKKKNARSGPKGKVHAISWLEDNGVVHPECGYRSSYQAWIGDDCGYKWERTDDPVTCKTCLKLINLQPTITMIKRDVEEITELLDDLIQNRAALKFPIVLYNRLFKWSKELKSKVRTASTNESSVRKLYM